MASPRHPRVGSGAVDGQRLLTPVVSAVVAFLVVALVVLVSTGGSALPGAGGRHAPRLPAVIEPTAGATTRTTSPLVLPGRAKIGVFRQTDRAAVEEFARWSGADVAYVTDFSARETWDQITDPDYMLAEWKDSGFRPVYGIAMLPKDPSQTMEDGARGDYDWHFRKLARNLVAADQGNAILRVGWEFNLRTSRWGTPDPQVYIQYFRHIVTAMHSVPGAQKLEFDWNVNNGDGNGFDAPLYYPGSDVVDYVGVDGYDYSAKPGTYPYPPGCDTMCREQRQEEAWNQQIFGGGRGLRFWAGFAAEQGVPLSLPEWGVWQPSSGQGGGDDAGYIRRMSDFISDPLNNVAYQAYFEYDGTDGHATHSLMKSFPRSGQAYRELFGKK